MKNLYVIANILDISVAIPILLFGVYQFWIVHNYYLGLACLVFNSIYTIDRTFVLYVTKLKCEK